MFGCHRYCIWKMKIIGIIGSRRRDTTADFDAIFQKIHQIYEEGDTTKNKESSTIQSDEPQNSI
jgi:hypothetical protein